MRSSVAPEGDRHAPAAQTAAEAEEEGAGAEADDAGAGPSAAGSGAGKDEPGTGDSGEESQAPEIAVLGPLAVSGVTTSGHGPKVAALAALIHLRPGRSAEFLCTAMDPVTPWSTRTLQSRLSEIRSRLGTAPDGSPYLPRPTHGYRFHPDVTSDWQRFQHLATRSLADPDAARRSALRGLEIDETSELLYRDWMNIEWGAGNTAGVRKAIARPHQVAGPTTSPSNPSPNSSSTSSCPTSPNEYGPDGADRRRQERNSRTGVVRSHSGVSRAQHLHSSVCCNATALLKGRNNMSAGRDKRCTSTSRARTPVRDRSALVRPRHPALVWHPQGTLHYPKDSYDLRRMC
ncbi:hypothetical protein [Streptomyces microflavus]